MTARDLTLLPALVCAVLLLAGCGGTPPEPPDPRDSSLRSGAADALDAAGVDVVALEDPLEVSPDEVVSALDDAGLDAGVLDPSDPAVTDALQLDPTRLTGIPTLVGDLPADGPQLLAVVFVEPADAWVFAESQPDVFAGDGTTRASLAGPVVVFTAGGAGDDLASDVRRALGALGASDAGTGTPSGSPSAQG